VAGLHGQRTLYLRPWGQLGEAGRGPTRNLGPGAGLAHDTLAAGGSAVLVRPPDPKADCAATSAAAEAQDQGHAGIRVLDGR
jgi:hypothetical protein